MRRGDRYAVIFSRRCVISPVPMWEKPQPTGVNRVMHSLTVDIFPNLTPTIQLLTVLLRNSPPTRGLETFVHLCMLEMA